MGIHKRSVQNFPPFITFRSHFEFTILVVAIFLEKRYLLDFSAVIRLRVLIVDGRGRGMIVGLVFGSCFLTHAKMH
jgi:hypothetical protein